MGNGEWRVGGGGGRRERRWKCTRWAVAATQRCAKGSCQEDGNFGRGLREKRVCRKAQSGTTDRKDEEVCQASPEETSRERGSRDHHHQARCFAAPISAATTSRR